MYSNHKTYQIISLIMAFLILFSSVGFSIDLHYCGTDLKSFSFTGKAKNCFELAKSGTCSKHQMVEATKPLCETSKKDCCHNKTFYVKGELTSDAPTTSFLISSLLQDFLLAFVVVFADKPTLKQSTLNFLHYKPPLIQKKIPVLVQSFLL